MSDWGLLFPSCPDTHLPEDLYYEELHNLNFAPFQDFAFIPFTARALHRTGGSNNWVVTEGSDGMPPLANDPHLGPNLPGTWYLCELNAPGLHVAGATFAGTPSIVIGHNGHVAWGLTDAMTDCIDLYVIRVDPAHPTTYYVDGSTLEMESREETFLLPNGDSRTLTVFSTIHGPVLSRVEVGAEAVVALKWYSTLSDAAIPAPRSLQAPTADDFQRI